MSLLTPLTSLVAQVSTDDGGGGFWFPPAASTLADPVDWIFFFITWICVFFFVLIVVLLVIFTVRYKRPPGVKAEGKVTHHTPLELTWTIIPLILVIAIFYLGLDGYVDMTQSPANAYEVNVTAQKWNWAFDHRNGAQDSQVLKVPAGRPVRLIMTSADVLHSVYIPSFRVKQDAVPGRYTTLWFEAPEPGTYQLFCTEYCGTQHSQMTAVVEVLEPEEFERQIAEDARWLDRYGDEQLRFAGPRLYARCASCHSLDGSAMTGPSFRQTYEQWGEPRVMGDGREVVIDENYIRNSILNPQRDVVANYGAVMPTFQGQLKEREITALIEFIKNLDEVVDETGQPRPFNLGGSP